MGVEFCRGICGVSVIRSGESMETALRECCQGIKLGKILVHRWVLRSVCTKMTSMYLYVCDGLSF